MLTAAPATVLAALRDRGGLRIDDSCGMAGELRWLFDGKAGGIRRHYLRADGMTLETFAEWLFDQRFTFERIDLRQACDLLAELFTPAKRKPARARIDVATLDRDATRAFKNRNRVYRCPECSRTRCNGAVKTCEVACVPCSKRSGALVLLVRGEMTFTEVMTQQSAGAAESAPF